MAVDPHLAPLLRAVRPRVVAKYLGQLALALALFSVVPVVVALLEGEYAFAAWVAGAVLLPALLLSTAARLDAPAPLQANEALVVTALTFLLAALFNAVPFAALGLAPLDALFEAVSGVTTTGLTTLGSVEGHGAAFLFTRAWLQWYGGLGVVVLSLALLTGPDADARKLAEAGWQDDLASSSRLHARRALGVYLLLTIGGVALLWSLGMSTFDALLHTLSGISTGGFSAYDASLAAFGSQAVEWGALGIAFLGALPLVLFHRAWRRGPAELLGDVEFRALLAAVALVALLLLLLMAARVGWAAALHHAPLLALTAQTGTGYSTTAVATLGAGEKWLLILSMFSGAGIGSTAGGIKIVRLLLLLRLIQLAVLRTQLPHHAVFQLQLGGRPVADELVRRALTVVLLFALLVLLSWLPFLIAGHAPLDALFEVVSAVGTVGLSTGISAPELAPGLKGVLIFDMLAGRVEVLALLVLLYPGSWRVRGR